jgi:ATP-dependent RNA helicase RhlE
LRGGGGNTRQAAALPAPAAKEIPTLTDTPFGAFGLSEPILRALRSENFETPTPIQVKAIPVLLEGRDLMAVAQTGTGKTAAFGLPLLERIAAARIPAPPKTTQALILAPTRELAVQIHQSLSVFAQHLKLRLGIVIGGVKMSPQMRQLSHGLHVLVATPGRLIDHIGERNVDLSRTTMLVLDEADRMLDMGFIHDVKRIANLCPKTRQSAMFSATMPADIAKLAGQILKDAERVQIAPSGTAAGRIEQKVIFVEKGRKLPQLLELLADPAFTRAIVFTRTKRSANRVSEQTAKAGIPAEALHGNKSQNARQKALAGFASGHARVLVATDIASRGIDVDQVSHVINFDLPEEPETYVHRIGRTARAGAEGVAVSLCEASERGALRAIEKLTGKALTVLGASAGTEEPQELRSSGAERGSASNSRSSNPKSGSTGSARSRNPKAGNAGAPRSNKAKGGSAGNLRSISPERASASKAWAQDRELMPEKRPQAKAFRASNSNAAPSGTVKWFNPSKGFGFVQPDSGGEDVYVHISEAKRAGLGTPREGLRVSFSVERDERGRMSATNLRAA